jgi:ADP-ribose pyrophosphatase YjhB (NUDIX family)
MIGVMRAENTKTYSFGEEFGFGDDFGIETIEKAKVGILGYVNQRPSVLLLTRSIHEDTRPGEHDWAGGKLDPGELPIDGLMRETEVEELPEVVLRYVTDLKTRDKTKEDGIRAISRLFIALAEFPSDRIERSSEHSEAEWWPLDKLGDSTLPNKYQAGLASPSGLIAVEGLMYIAQQEAIQPSGTAWHPTAAPPLEAPALLPRAA